MTLFNASVPREGNIFSATFFLWPRWRLIEATHLYRMTKCVCVSFKMEHKIESSLIVHLEQEASLNGTRTPNMEMSSNNNFLLNNLCYYSFCLFIDEVNKQQPQCSFSSRQMSNEDTYTFKRRLCRSEHVLNIRIRPRMSTSVLCVMPRAVCA